MANQISTRKLAGAVIVLAAAVGIGIVIREFRSRPAVEKLPAQAPKAVQPPDIPQTRPAPKEPEIQNIEPQAPIEEVFVEPAPLESEPVSPLPSPTVKNPLGLDPQFNNPVYKEQLGRYVLSFVGDNPGADEIWAVLINDASLSGQVRQDLIEDLNENGFSGANGRVATVNDVPLILNRLALLEENEPYAMDNVNADAFQEAYKDLMNMYVRLSQ
jgi:hypothetical protein